MRVDESKIRRAIQHRRPPMMASSTMYSSRPCGPSAHDRTYELRRAGPQRPPPPVTRQLPPRMTRVTPCGKCLRVSILIQIDTSSQCKMIVTVVFTTNLLTDVMVIMNEISSNYFNNWEFTFPFYVQRMIAIFVKAALRTLPFQIMHSGRYVL